MDWDDLPMPVNSDIIKKILCLKKMNTKPARLELVRTNLRKNGYPEGPKKVNVLAKVMD